MHDDETRRLMRVLEQKERELAGLTPTEWGAVSAAQEAVVAARSALNEHATRSKHFVRNYRIFDLDSGAELDRFTMDYEVAPWTASKRMAEKLIQRYDLQEQQGDGTWLSYYAD
ncbi:hypothetical protein [Arthrobacter sp. 24S4-2]|uniref:hypothetical protein n=1 Tax=Arthrobacter sp. 24S4-2 TaxID=2575374 RepID=UPI001C301CFC|nr:hypothetical protein [Arthrobacter sp. 24S4-2]